MAQVTLRESVWEVDPSGKFVTNEQGERLPVSSLAPDEQAEVESVLDPGHRPATVFDPEWADYKALVYVLLRSGVPYDAVHAVTSKENPTLDDLVDMNKNLMQLSSQYGLPREWLMQQMREQGRNKSRRTKSGGLNMSWLTKKAGPFGGAGAPESELPLPTKMNPGAPGAGPAKPPMPPAGAGPAPMGGPAKPPMGAPAPKPPMGAPAPGGLHGGDPSKANPAVSEVKRMLDSGDLRGALEKLKDAVGPAAGGPDGAPSHKHAPDLGKPAPKPAPKAGPDAPKKDGPPAPSKDKEEPKKEDKKDESKSAALALYDCGACGTTLRARCVTCAGKLSVASPTMLDLESEEEALMQEALGLLETQSDPNAHQLASRMREFLSRHPVTEMDEEAPLV